MAIDCYLVATRARAVCFMGSRHTLDVLIDELPSHKVAAYDLYVPLTLGSGLPAQDLRALGLSMMQTAPDQEKEQQTGAYDLGQRIVWMAHQYPQDLFRLYDAHESPPDIDSHTFEFISQLDRDALDERCNACGQPLLNGSKT